MSRAASRANGRNASLFALLACAALTWYLTYVGLAGMPPAPGTMGLGLLGFLAAWELMMAAMMLPSLAPLTTAYLHTIRSVRSTAVRAGRTAALVAGYLVTWLGFGIIAYAVASLAATLTADAPRVAPWVGAGLLVAAGIYQLTPLKDFCLRHCRSPMSFLLHVSSYKGRMRDFRVGAYHGAYCVGCCWGLMVVLLAVGVMNLIWMAAIAAAILVEKMWTHGRAFSRLTGVLLIAVALFVPAHPELLPGFHSVMTMTA